MDTQMEKYRATRDFGMAGLNIQRGMIIEFDGYNIAVAGRPPQPLPTFKGAIKTGWAVVAAAYDEAASSARPQSANIRVRPADTGNPSASRPASSLIATTQSEEQVVNNVQEHAAGVRQTNQTRKFAAAGVEPQDGVPVRTLQTLANSRDGVRTTLTGSNTQEALSAASSVQISPGRGITREEMMERMTPEQRAAYKAEIDARRMAHLPLDQQVAVRSGDGQVHVVATIAAPKDLETMGMHVTTTVGGGMETMDLSGLDSDAPAVMRTVESEGMRFTTTNGPKKAVVVVGARKDEALEDASLEDVDPRRVIARAICRDFPDLYDFDLPLRKKLARLRADFDDRPDVIRAVAAAETDSEMRLLLVDEFPEAFQTQAP